MSDFIFSLIRDFGYFGMFLGMVLEAVIIIIPSEAILATGGILASQKVFSFWGAFFVGLIEICLNIVIKVHIKSMVKNLIFKAIDTYAQAYEEIESSVIDKIRNYKRKLLAGTDEYELVFEQLYQEELKRRGF